MQMIKPTIELISKQQQDNCVTNNQVPVVFSKLHYRNVTIMSNYSLFVINWCNFMYIFVT